MPKLITPVEVDLTDSEYEILSNLAKRLKMPRNKVLADAVRQIVQASLPDYFAAIEAVDGKQN